MRRSFKKAFVSPFGWIALLFLLCAKGHLEIIDTEYSVRTALAIIEQRSMLIDAVDPLVLEIAPQVEGTDKIYSQYGLDFAFLSLPIVLTGKVLANPGGIEQRIPIDFLLSFYNIPFAILGLGRRNTRRGSRQFHSRIYSPRKRHLRRLSIHCPRLLVAWIDWFASSPLCQKKNKDYY